MAPPMLLCPFSKLLDLVRLSNGSLMPSKFYELPRDRPDWMKVGLTLGTSSFLWIYLIK
uniref:NADH dehydrogenase [ubiquinone] 1 subunit C1, mitochondrial n=1 Tax=Felis catus TaxID=9685 RepID=A0ABI8AS88_FELCA